MQFFLRVLISALIIAGVAELGRRYSVLAAILASLPLTSILALSFLYAETRQTEQVVTLSWSIFWAVLPSLIFFIALPTFIRFGFGFVPALLSSCVVMALAYSAYVALLGRFGVML
jgi:uncharacterized membrane protein (GlpM family)